MFLRAFGRLPEDHEIGHVLGFLEAQKARYGDVREDDPRLWVDLAHVLMNTTEFIYVR
jgi:hypothetical protein